MKIASAILGISGLICVGMLDGWWDALGMFLMVWGNNLSNEE